MESEKSSMKTAHVVENPVDPSPGAKQLYVTCTVDGIPVDMLIDTGAGVSMMNRATYVQTLGYKMSRLKQTDRELRGVANDAVATHGVLKCEMGIGTRRVNTHIVVAEMDIPAILGLRELLHFVRSWTLASPSCEWTRSLLISILVKWSTPQR